MCRIAGTINKQLPITENKRRVAAMCHALTHGGPDDEGIYTAENDNLVFGHRRLSIIDLSQNGHQPMLDAGGKASITFNGEIYNYQVLRHELQTQGVTFQSQTDTEVIIQAYLIWGTEAFAKLRGMFAFALHDIAHQQVYLVRDTAGIKPLYYHIENQALSFASEVRAFKAGDITHSEDPTWHIRFLAYGHVPEPQTTLKNVLSLRKGEMLCWDISSGAYSINNYKKPSTLASLTNVNEATTAIKNALIAAVKRQLIADAPIGVFLSGGIDSSLLTLLAAKQKHEQLNTVSIFFNEEDYNERAYQKIVAEKFEGQKFSHLVTQGEFNSNLPHFIAAMDTPTTDGLNSWFISRYARQDGLKAVLSGLGADELFGGYPSFNRLGYMQQLQRLPKPIISLITPLLNDRYKKISYLSHPGHLALYLSMRALFIPADIASLLACEEQQVWDVLFDEKIYRQQPDANNRYEIASGLESNIYMQNQLLRDTDVMSMCHGLEVRVPFLDEDFQAVVKSINPQLRFSKTRSKKMLTDSFADILPDAIWNRPKMGFSFPLQQWMGKHAAITDEHFYRGKLAKKVIREFKNGRVHWSKAFALYLSQLNA